MNEITQFGHYRSTATLPRCRRRSRSWTTEENSEHRDGCLAGSSLFLVQGEAKDLGAFVAENA